MKFLLFIFFICTLYAQDTVYTLQPVEIIAARPVINFQSFEFIEKDEIQNFNTALSLDETFTKIPGLLISNRNNPSLGDKISIRGIGARSSFGIRGIKILVDNIPLTLPDGQSQSNNIDFFSSGKVEILKGPASSFYGNAAGGVINFQSEFPANNILNITPEIILGSYGFQKYSLKLSGVYNQHSYLISLNNINNEGYREHSASKIYLLNTIYRNTFSDKISLTAVINYFNSPYLLSPGSLSKEAVEQNRKSVREFNKLQGTGEKANQFQTGATVNYLTQDFKFETTLYFVRRNLVNPIPGRIIELNRNSGGLRSFINKKFFIDENEINISGGVDIEFQNDLRNEFENNGLPHTGFNPGEIFQNLSYGNNLINQEENVFSSGPFISINYLMQNFGVQTGLRYDYYTFEVNDFLADNNGERSMQQLSPAAGIFYLPSSNSKIFLNYSTSFLTPTTSELSNRSDAAGGFNPELNPEKIFQYELGFTFSDFFNQKFLKGIDARLSLYYLNFNGLIIPYQQQNSEEVFFRNAGEAENKGAEIMMESHFSGGINFLLSYSFMDFVFSDYIVEYENNFYQLKGNEVPGVPQQNIFLQLGYETNQ